MTTASLIPHTCQEFHGDLQSGDDSLRLAVLKLLGSSSYAPLRRLRCRVTDAVAVVHGTVPSYYLKQMAQALIQRLYGVRRVMNLVEVRRAETAYPLNETFSWEETADEFGCLSKG